MEKWNAETRPTSEEQKDTVQGERLLHEVKNSTIFEDFRKMKASFKFVHLHESLITF